MYGGAGSRTPRYPRRGMMKRGWIVLLGAVISTGIYGTPARAFDQPLLNFRPTNRAGARTAGGPFGPGGPPSSATPGPIGDVIIGPFIQWFPHKLLGRPFLHRFELDVIVPTGHYDKKDTITPGANVWSTEQHT